MVGALLKTLVSYLDDHGASLSVLLSKALFLGQLIERKLIELPTNAHGLVREKHSIVPTVSIRRISGANNYYQVSEPVDQFMIRQEMKMMRKDEIGERTLKSASTPSKDLIPFVCAYRRGVVFSTLGRQQQKDLIHRRNSPHSAKCHILMQPRSAAMVLGLRPEAFLWMCLWFLLDVQEKTATMLKNIATVAALDANAHQSIAHV
ncbi:hypothetical protein LguiB_012274 [Lonicera macranthoides]